MIDKEPDAKGVVYPDRANPVVTLGSTCQETLNMIAGRYVRCGDPACAIVEFVGRDEGPYFMCFEHAWHTVRNRGGRLLADETVDRELTISVSRRPSR